jgi:hypothetical protein
LNSVTAMTFEEFLLTINALLLDIIKKAYADNTALSTPLHDKAMELWLYTDRNEQI